MGTSRSDSGRRAASNSGELNLVADRHNANAGSALRRAAQVLVMLYISGPVLYVFFRIFFRVQVIGAERVGAAGRAILAGRHFYEWDPALLYAAAFFPRCALQPRTIPLTLAGPFWMKTRVRRLFSLLYGVLAVVRGGGSGQSAFTRAAELLQSRAVPFVTVFPTGPVGRSTTYEVRPGVGHLADACPDVPVIPFVLTGIQGLDWGAVRRLERPIVTISFEPPFTAADFAVSRGERAAAVCGRIASAWNAAERRLAANPADYGRREAGAPVLASSLSTEEIERRSL